MAAETCSVQFNADQLRKVERCPLLHSDRIFTLHSSHHPAAHTFFPAPAEGTYLLQINIKIKLAISPNPQISACHFAVIEVQKKNL